MTSLHGRNTLTISYIRRLSSEDVYRVYLLADYWEGAEIYEIDPVGPFSYYPWGGTA